MKTVQQLWRPTLAGLALAAALAPAPRAARSEPPPAAGRSPGAGKRAERSPEEKKRRREIEDIEAELSRRLKELEGATTKEKIGELRVRIDELQAEKAELEAPLKQAEARLKQAEASRKAMQARQLMEAIKVFRLKQEDPQEVGEILTRLLAPEGGYYFLGRGTRPGPRANPPGDRKGRRGPSPGTEDRARPPEAPRQPQQSEMPDGTGGSPRTPAAPEQGWTFTVDRRTNALIVRGQPPVLQVASDLVALLDTPPSSPLPQVKTLRGFRLRYASPREVANILRQLNFHNARVVGLEKSNLLIVMASEADLKEIGELVKDLDVKGKEPAAEGR
jgi:hypothetical protein